MTPDQLFLSIKRHLKKERIICFVSVFAFGFLAHMYKLTNTLPNWDSLNNVYSSQNTIHLGRCFLTLACGISSYYDLPWLNGILSLFYLGIISILVSEIFDIKKTILLILASGLLATFPTVTSTFSYMYTADGYFLGMLCMTLAIYLSLRYDKGWLPGMLLLGFGYGCYQAYITWAILLVLFWSIARLMFTQTTSACLLRKLTHCVLCGAGGTLLYWICNNLLLTLQNVALASYQGIGEIGLSSFQPLYAMRQCLIDFAYFFLGPLGRMNLYSYLNIGILLFLVVCSVIHIIRRRLYKKPDRFALLLLFAAAVPFVAFAIYFVSPNTNYHMLMMMSLCLVYIFLLLFYEHFSADSKPAFLQWIIILLTGLTIYNFILVANISYLTMQQSYDRSRDVLLRLADRIEQTAGSANCTRMTVIGQLPESYDLSLNLPPDMTGIIDGYIMSTPFHYQAMLSQYCDLSYDLLADEEQERLLANEALLSLPIWPQDGCISIVDDILVIRMGN